MQEEIKDLIYSIGAGNTSDVQDSFQSIMAQKVSAALDDMRIDVAKNMFNPQQTSEE